MPAIENVCSCGHAYDGAERDALPFGVQSTSLTGLRLELPRCVRCAIRIASQRGSFRLQRIDGGADEGLGEVLWSTERRAWEVAERLFGPRASEYVRVLAMPDGRE